MSTEIKWCCAGFEGHWQQAGKRGAAILVDHAPPGRMRFVLQYRAADAGKTATVESDVPVSLVTDITIQFCPWCGQRLVDWYGGTRDQLARDKLTIDSTGQH